jgi:hypothetical protein
MAARSSSSVPPTSASAGSLFDRSTRRCRGRVRIRSPPSRTSSHSSLPASSLSLGLSLSLCVPRELRTLTRPPPCLAVVPSRRSQIAATETFAVVLCLASPKHAGRDGENLREIAVPFSGSGLTPSSITATSSSLWPRRPHARLRGELVHSSPPFSLRWCPVSSAWSSSVVR